MPVVRVSDEEEKVYHAAEMAAIWLKSTGHSFATIRETKLADMDPVLMQGLQDIGVSPSEEQTQRIIIRLRAALLASGMSIQEVDRIALDSDLFNTHRVGR